jgi:MFS family permease
MLLTFLIPVIEDIWDLQSPWGSMIGMCVFFGGLVGSPIFSKISDIYGRRKVLIFCAFVVALAGTFTAFVTNIYCLLVCRFFTGIGIVGMIISLTLSQEFVPQDYRGKMGVFEQWFWSAGSLFSVLLAWLILPSMDEDTGWRYYVGLSTIPA